MGLSLTTRDLDILALVESFRILTSDHIQALVAGSNQGILRRLQKLFHGGFLDRLRPENRDGGGSEKMIYAITNKGMRELQQAGRIQSPTTTDWNAQNRGLRDLSVRHTLLVSHIRAVLTAACRERGFVRLLFWKEGPQVYDAIEVALPEGYTRVPVAPDAFLGLEDARGKMYFFLEADRGTMTTKRVLLKLRAYAAYWKERHHETKFGIKYYRVLIVTTSAARLGNLAAAAKEALGQEKLGRMFYFSSVQALRLGSPESVFERIWTTLGSREPCSLLA